MQRGLGKAARSWGGSAVLGVSPMSDCRGLPHERLPWFPPLAIASRQSDYLTRQLGRFSTDHNRC
ncbi:hypothetical protein [Moorena sp. SIO3H5]|uniref:hypothetical protein n=1 Tax=Moorena sp. SIO3H5 TaxID=2607834 RepID=UPI0013B5FBF7|nr:hypothetical protein [Moorena sp. SIO3H5]NEO71577.1 hypothetical protein [Moorena sp. SIO3H5]